MKIDGPKTYSNNPDFDHSLAVDLSKDQLDMIMDNTVVPCVDVLMIDSHKKALLLAERTSRPAEGLWFVGGRIARDLDIESAAIAVVKRETGTDISPSKLGFLAVNRFAWDYRKFDPNKRGRVDVNFCYTYEPTDDELDHMRSRLTDDEYDITKGIRPYTRKELEDFFAGSDTVNARVLLDYWDKLFN